MAWHRTSAKSRGYGHHWAKLRKIVIARDNALCQPCLRNDIVQAGNEVDHVTPKAKGGTDDLGNLETICGPCHREKTARESAEAKGQTYRPRLTFGVDGWPV